MGDTDAEASTHDGGYVAARDAALAAGFHPVTLGGVMLWERPLGDGTCLKLSCNGAIGEASWSIGRHGDGGGSVAIRGLTLTRALAKADRLPTPLRNVGDHSNDEFDCLEAALTACGFWVPQIK